MKSKPQQSKLTFLTAFQPFQGRGVNGSTTMLRWLRRHFPVGRFRSRILPVAWDAAPHLLQRLLDQHRPIAYLGIGEGHPGRIAWEMVAHNQHHGTDEIGQHLDPHPICPRGPDSLSSTWEAPAFPPVHLLPEALPFVTSSDAGRFLCNRVLWQALHAQSQPLRAAFLHLPPQGAQTNADYIRAYGPFVRSLLLA